MDRILIADPSVQDREYVRNRLEDRFLVDFCYDGRNLLDDIRRFDPDLLFMDLRLPNADGLNLLRDIRDTGNTIPIIVSTSCLQDSIFPRLMQLKVAMVLVKPWRLDELLNGIRQISLSDLANRSSSPEDELEYILLRLGFKAGNNRYGYIRLAVLERYKCSGTTLSKGVYPAVAASFNTGTDSVEKAIRDGIRYAKTAGNAALWQSYFPALRPGKCPTNEEFINRMAIAIRTRERHDERMEISMKLAANT